MPVRRSLLPRGGMVALNRELRYGNLMAMQLLDTRQYRDDQPCGDGFKLACPGVFDKQAQVLGKAQEDWLARNLGTGGATWNALAQQVKIGRAHVCTPVTNAHLVCRLLLTTNTKPQLV